MERHFLIWLNSSFESAFINLNSFKIDFDFFLINAIDLHCRYRIKIYFMKKECVRTLDSKKLKMSHIFYC